MTFYETVSIVRFMEDDKRAFGVVGIHYGPLIIMMESSTKILAYRKGRNEWYAVGTQKYYPPSFIVFTKKSNDILINPLSSPEFEYRRGERKEAYRKAVERFNAGSG